MRFKPQVDDKVFISCCQNSRGYKNTTGRVTKVGNRYIYVAWHDEDFYERETIRFYKNSHEQAYGQQSKFHMIYKDKRHYDKYLENIKLKERILQLLDHDIVLSSAPTGMLEDMLTNLRAFR